MSIENLDSQPINRKNTVHFNTFNALQRLERGENFAEVFELMFGWPWEQLSTKDLNRSYVGSGADAKKIVNTLLTAASHDIAATLKQLPNKKHPTTASSKKDPYMTPYQMDDLVPRKPPFAGLVKNSLLPIWNFNAGQVLTTIREAEMPTFNQTLKNCDQPVACPPYEASRVIRDTLRGASQTLLQRGDRYLQLLVEVYGRDAKEDKTIAQLMEIAISSGSIFGQPAAIDFDYFVDYGLRFESFDAVENGMKYKKDKYTLQAKRNAAGNIITRVVPKREELRELQEVYETDPYNNRSLEVVTGCPANAELIEATLRHFRRQVYLEAA